ncbi:MAG: saccharopine dehydrogenase C-terminal domain-containing protein [Synergistota bacterium]|nr:saccharopine dehydrogenase C-terminal domain-containing protein [Synergistota bacterium]
MKTIFVLGAGMVSAPCVDYLVRKANCKVVVGDISTMNLGMINSKFPMAETIKVNVEENINDVFERYSPYVVINLMPPAFNDTIAKLCLEKQIHHVHPNYVSKETLSLNSECKKHGLVFITELGLDPGIDHMSAAKKINEIHSKNGMVCSYVSNCGALPAIDSNNNPWGYKLSWSPSSLIGASKRTARILNKSKEYYWPDGNTYEHVEICEVPGLGTFEKYANGDSIPYREFYDIPEAETIYRGTVRYPGWCETICYMNMLGFFELDKKDTQGMTFAEFTARQAGRDNDPETALCDFLNLKPWSAFILRMKWLGFFEDRPLPFDKASPRDVVTVLFSEKLVFDEKERDLVILMDEIKVKNQNGSYTKYISTLIDHGIPGKWTSIARTTGIPPAIAAKFILDGKISIPGVHVPTISEIYVPILEELKSEGIEMNEKIINDLV